MSPRTWIFFFDGTMNGRDDEYPTNVQKLAGATRFSDQVPVYLAGPGNEDENGKFMQMLGGAFGVGSWAIVDMAMNFLRSVYLPGDQIATVGFSRGAANARMFCSTIGKEGVNGNWPNVDFLGCFDTVGAYAPYGMFQQGVFHDLKVSPAVKLASHAVALHEDRDPFIPNLMDKRPGVTEVWFPGVHCDVGGGSAETGHSDTALKWMVSQMRAAGIRAAMETNPNSSAPIGVNKGRYPRSPRRVGVKIDGEWSNEAPKYIWTPDQHLT